MDHPEALERGIALFNAGHFWEAHEAWETVWKAAKNTDPALASFAQGLIWCAAAWVKRRAGEPNGARLHADRVAGRMNELVPVVGAVFHGMDLAAIVSLAGAAADGGQSEGGSPMIRAVRSI